MDEDEARVRLLDAAERLFYRRGIQAVGMDELRAAAGVSLKRLYQCFGSKQELVEAYLRRRDGRWRAALFAYVDEHSATPEDRPLAVFDWLHAWCADPDFRGCAFINSFGELGAVSDGVAQAARDHKQAVHEHILDLTRALCVTDPVALAAQLLLLVDGAITTAAISGDPEAARHARHAAQILIAAATVPSGAVRS
ncbi:TetR family transcriptional regulator [Streptomyces sulfonofaciens]|uniref:TetR family transcriptional regulator n=1 Tax=Streptomyces sulfonofaciens TaxID=68272 RepID=A0A919L8W3_9ACTN|nr:TetR/AcrR family transcriptional regulator [Streptomyces sulfonofaciens]GHH87759.1 TetR family transcriptional regulator [Streptomyces sulfonofaciens]